MRNGLNRTRLRLSLPTMHVFNGCANERAGVASANKHATRTVRLKEGRAMPSTFADVRLTAEEIHHLMQFYKRDTKRAKEAGATVSVEYDQKRLAYFQQKLTEIWGAEWRFYY